MILEEGIEILNRFFKVSTLIEDDFGYFDDGAILVGDYSSSSGHIINERNFSERITWVIIDAFFFALVLLVLALHAINSFEDDVEVLSLVALLENHLMHLMILQIEVQSHLLERLALGVKWFLDEDDFLNLGAGTLRILTSSSRS